MQRVFFLCLFVAGGCAPDLPELVSDTQRDCSVDDDCDTAAFELCVDQRCITDPRAVDNDYDQFTEFQGDCNDDDTTINPDAREVCGDSIDQNCDGTDVACSLFDADGDGVTVAAGDCDDQDPERSPALVEICGDLIDNNCSLETDLEPDDTDGDLDCNYADEDRDGFAVFAGGVLGFPPGDCNDQAASINPNAVEVCGDTVDQDCDGLAPTCREFDEDRDGFALDGGGVLGIPGGDCDDTNGSINPIAIEICGNAVDEDCDTFSPSCAEFDEDKDGFALTGGGVLGLPGGDCDDADPYIHPDAIEICEDGINQNCRAETLANNDPANNDQICPEHADNDGDGFAEVAGGPLSATGGDCDDANSSWFPGAAELCNLLDDNCNGLVDELTGNCPNHDLDGGDLLFDRNETVGGYYFNVGDFTVEAGKTLTVAGFEEGGDGTLRIEAATITVAGTIDATGKGFGGGGGGGGGQVADPGHTSCEPGDGGSGYLGGQTGYSGMERYGSSPTYAGDGGVGGQGGGISGGLGGAGGVGYPDDLSCSTTTPRNGEKGSPGGDGGYASSGVNGDTSGGDEIYRGSGGGGGGGQGGDGTYWFDSSSGCASGRRGCGDVGFGGSPGGGSVALVATDELTVTGEIFTVGLNDMNMNSNAEPDSACPGDPDCDGDTANAGGGAGAGGGILLRSDTGSITVGGAATLDAMGGSETCTPNSIEPNGPNGTVKVFAPIGNYTIASIRNRTCAGRLCDGVPDSGICTNR